MGFFTKDKDHLWLFSIVPYVIDSAGFPPGSAARKKVTDAINHWNTNTNITFTPRIDEEDYVEFVRHGSSCNSEVGKQGGRQEIKCNIDDKEAGNVIHEIGHAIGLFHEHVRPDRDRFVNVNLNNVPEEKQHNYEVKDEDEGLIFTEYDYGSIMHYGKVGGSAIDKNINTIVPISWFGGHNQGGGIAIGDLTKSKKHDLFIFNIDNPSGENHGYYRIGRQLVAKGEFKDLSDLTLINGWFGSENQGGDIAIGEITGTRDQDLVVFHIDNPRGENAGYYRIGWKLDLAGNPERWSNLFRVPGWFGASNQGGGVELADINQNGKQDLVVFHIDNPQGENRGYYRIGWDLNKRGNPGNGWSEIKPIPGWFGASNQGGGIAIGNLKNRSQLDLVVFHIDNPQGENKGYYRIGWNLDKNGDPDSWSEVKEIPGWFGTENNCGSIAIGNLTRGRSRDLIVFHIDNPLGENRGYYRIGWNIASNGNIKAWSEVMPVHNFGKNAIDDIGQRKGLSTRDISAVNQRYPIKAISGVAHPVPNWFGASNQAGDIAVADLMGNGNQDLVVFHIDNPNGENSGYYRIGWDLDGQAIPKGGWSEVKVIPGWFGGENQGGGIALADLNGNGKQDLIVFHIDNPPGENSGYYRIGWNLNENGDPTGWSEIRQIPGWFGGENQGGGIAIRKRNGKNDLFVFHIDRGGDLNRGYYRIGKKLDTNGTPAEGWSEVKFIPSWSAYENQGGGVVIGDLKNEGKQDLVVFHLQNNYGGENRGKLRIGRDLDSNGDPQEKWSQPIHIAGWHGAENQGGGVALADLDKNGELYLITFFIDNPEGENRGFYRVSKAF